MTRFLAALALLAFAFSPISVMAADVTHKVAIHVDQNDHQVMNMALNNAKNIDSYYNAKGETVEIELVAYGPGLMMLRDDKSPVKDRISAMSLEIDNISFSACGNTHRAMSKKEGKEVELLDEATMVPSGAVRLIELQEQGFAYIRP
ncbi:DsrE family protein [Roseibium algae]|uniref:DsrE family protein n=1 Tax=Roseibium algae TaxID=3123038 RepID=A0ABU8TGE3_9HYPH